MLDFLKDVVDPTQLNVLVALLGGNFVLGILAALKADKFELVKTIDIWKRTLIVVGSYLVVAIVATELTEFQAIRTAYWAALVAYMGSQILSNLSGLSGINLPESIQKLIER